MLVSFLLPNYNLNCVLTSSRQAGSFLRRGIRLARRRACLVSRRRRRQRCCLSSHCEPRYWHSRCCTSQASPQERMLRLLWHGVRFSAPSLLIVQLTRMFTSCSLFWKAFGIVLLGFVLWNAFKLARWASTVRRTMRSPSYILTRLLL